MLYTERKAHTAICAKTVEKHYNLLVHLDCSTSSKGVDARELPMPPSPGGTLNPVLGSRLAKGPLNPPGLVQISNFDESEIPRPNGVIISSLPNSHEAVLESLGSMSPAELVGVCNEVIVQRKWMR
ncbi:hypothetical protein Nepgr_006728 [Nepenthes gracilis]|uniref:Uncharacterized protein n=1 Tax=Nepenthes gracilis TaxID=150966 RepID=A0AAD3XHM4_NEPGR|nr:hypothetical protein Nepgr_006728 [Nepenthes gracilis]